MTKDEKKRKYCPGCRNNFYNGNNPYGVQECWSLPSAKVVWRKRVHINQRPPWNQKPQRVLDCYHERGYVYVGADQTH